ncbi:MAG TPA: 4Fe-4S dicluster domain-containing protein [Candidatus Nitrosotenuis sp.]|jgi:molybdopterin-containing oxidoreductase family iron-sulfur binding subunit|nr:4Fe-4S dicluster domain-containing protein [Candidatus Nitrosotenuis sp.]
MAEQMQAQSRRQYGMVIDIDRCNGCQACVIACRSENNIPVVGPEQCAKGRILDWLHVDRYWYGEHSRGEEHGSPSSLHADFVPMLCQHCSNPGRDQSSGGGAPCESVCPVYASLHTEEGLNAQIYNRCIGTFTCANNCPYHVRVFNWYQGEWPRPLDQLLNPDVTVRSEGVMEKCTFCVQRIRRADHDARSRGEQLHDGEVRPACVQACPTSALVFGRWDDPDSAINRLVELNEERTYKVLDEAYHTRPSIVYLRPVREENVF